MWFGSGRDDGDAGTRGETVMRSLAGWLYAGAASVAIPLLNRHLARRARQGKEQVARLPERRGLGADRPMGRLLWLHAASIGESVSVLPLLAALHRLDPALHVLLTTGTVTSAALMETRLADMGLAAAVTHRFVPLDVPLWAARFLNGWKPDAAVFVESELWPNLLAACRSRGVPHALLNGRLSARSARSWRIFPALVREMLAGMQFIMARSGEDAARFRSLGGMKVQAAGDLKFAAPPLPADPAALRLLQAQIGGRAIFLAASTHPGEDEVVLGVHTRLAGESVSPLLTVIVPRHPERGAMIAPGSPRRSLQQALPPADESGIYVADTIGELGLFYRVADCAFIGGSLIPHGGQNPLEAARLACPCAAGPHMENFADAVEALEAVGGLIRVDHEAGLTDFVRHMVNDPDEAAARGQRACAAVQGWDDLPRRLAVMVSEMTK
ncbi:3-deoxy-D-manno-octulosonic-acid transferase [Granulibacter bethesdensis]|nr:3-deoxy-D-manno-octulosonic-acid transferase [Granulibacter bethesdensis]